MRVRVRPAVDARQACESAGLKWNAPRQQRAGTVAVIDSLMERGFCRLRWDEEVSQGTGRVDVTYLKMPLSALVTTDDVAAAIHWTSSAASEACVAQVARVGTLRALGVK